MKAAPYYDLGFDPQEHKISVSCPFQNAKCCHALIMMFPWHLPASPRQVKTNSLNQFFLSINQQESMWLPLHPHAQ